MPAPSSAAASARPAPPRPPGPLIPVLLGLALLLGGIGAMGGWISIAGQARTVASAERVDGVVTELSHHSERSGTKLRKRSLTITIIAKVDFPWRGATHTTDRAHPDGSIRLYHGGDSDRSLDLQRRYARGATVPVFVPSGDPARAFLLRRISGSSLWLAIVGSALALSATIGLLHRRRTLRHPRRLFFASLAGPPLVVAFVSLATTGSFLRNDLNTWVGIVIYLLFTLLLPAIGYQPRRAKNAGLADA